MDYGKPEVGEPSFYPGGAMGEVKRSPQPLHNPEHTHSDEALGLGPSESTHDLQTQDLPDTLREAPASMTPLLGRTQYLRGAVVFTLKHTFLSVGLPSFRLVVTTSVKGPKWRERQEVVVL